MTAASPCCASSTIRARPRRPGVVLWSSAHRCKGRGEAGDQHDRAEDQRPGQVSSGQQRHQEGDGGHENHSCHVLRSNSTPPGAAGYATLAPVPPSRRSMSTLGSRHASDASRRAVAWARTDTGRARTAPRRPSSPGCVVIDTRRGEDKGKPCGGSPQGLPVCLGSRRSEVD